MRILPLQPWEVSVFSHFMCVNAMSSNDFEFGYVTAAGITIPEAQNGKDK
jgi:hypothetical protein